MTNFYILGKHKILWLQFSFSNSNTTLVIFEHIISFLMIFCEFKFFLIFLAVLQRNIRIRMILSERVYTLRNRKKHLFSLMELNKTKNDTSFVQIKVFHVWLSHDKYFKN